MARARSAALLLAAAALLAALLAAQVRLEHAQISSSLRISARGPSLLLGYTLRRAFRCAMHRGSAACTSDTPPSLQYRKLACGFVSDPH